MTVTSSRSVLRSVDAATGTLMIGTVARSTLGQRKKSVMRATKKHTNSFERGMIMEHEMITVTPEIAQEFLERNHNNRKIKPRKVDKFAYQLSQGQWITNGDTIRFDVKGTLIDGQHRLKAVVIHCPWAELVSKLIYFTWLYFPVVVIAFKKFLGNLGCDGNHFMFHYHSPFKGISMLFCSSHHALLSLSERAPCHGPSRQRPGRASTR